MVSGSQEIIRKPWGWLGQVTDCSSAYFQGDLYCFYCTKDSENRTMAEIAVIINAEIFTKIILSHW